MRETLADLTERARSGSWMVSVPAAPAVGVMNVTSRLRIWLLGAYHALMYDCEMYFDLVRTKRELDWSPRYSNAEMFRESYDWYVAHRDGPRPPQHLPPPLAHEARRPARFRSGSRFLPSIRA